MIKYTNSYLFYFILSSILFFINKRDNSLIFFITRINFQALKILIINLLFINTNQTFNSIFLNLNINSSLSNFHHNTPYKIQLFVLLSLKELKCIELNACSWSLLGHSIFSIHLIALLWHFELVCHIIAEWININDSS